MSNLDRSIRLAALGAALAVGSWADSARAADPWSGGAQWFSLRAGYAKSVAAGAPDGNFGAGFGYTRFRNSKWAFGAHAEINVLGRYGRARQLEIPWTVEVARHYKWTTPLRPYLALGGGTYYHKISGTGRDGVTILPGGYGAFGANVPISPSALLGLDVRINVVRGSNPDDPVFGSRAVIGEEQERVVHWGVKLNYARVF